MTYGMAHRVLEDLRQCTTDLQWLDGPRPSGATSRDRAFSR
jgi:hypothetical protein